MVTNAHLHGVRHWTPWFHKVSFLLFSFSLFLFLSFRTRFPSKASKLQKLRSVMSDIITIWHCFGTQQIDISLCFCGWRWARFLPTFLASFSGRTSTASPASTSAALWFSYFTRFVSCRLKKQMCDLLETRLILLISKQSDRAPLFGTQQRPLRSYKVTPFLTYHDQLWKQIQILQIPKKQFTSA